MTATKTPGRGHDKQQPAGVKQQVATKLRTQRPKGGSTRAVVLSLDTTPQHSTKGASSHVTRARAGEGTLTARGAKLRAAKASPQPVQSTSKTHWTIEAASRVASATARAGDGKVKEGSFAASAMSRAMKGAHQPRGSK